MADFRSAPVPYDPTPDAAPTTQAPNDYFNVHANPNDFGAQIGEGVQKLGAGMADFAAKSQVIHDESQVNASMTTAWKGVNDALYAPPKTDAQGNPIAGTGGYYSLRGADAVNAYQPTVDKLNQIYQDTRSAQTPRQQNMFDSLMRRQFESQLRDVGSHSARQGEAMQDTQTTALMATASDSAVLAATNGKFDDFDHFIDQGQSAAIHWSDLKGLGAAYGQEQAAKFVGTTVENAAKQFIAQGDPNTAQILFDQYKDKMDKGSALGVETALKTHTRDVAAQAEANSYLGIGPATGGDDGSAPAASSKAPTGAPPSIAPAPNGPPAAPAGPGSTSAGAGTAAKTAAPPASGAPPSAASLLQHFEGFSAKPYWDTNAYRAGYGSDTVTHADGSVEKIRPGMLVSREDADRDLARRSTIFASNASQQVGADNWAKLPAGAQAALTSVAYNYGHLPGNVAAAVKSGDLNQIADSVASLPANHGRRLQEAAVIRGGGAPGGPAPTAGSSPSSQQGTTPPQQDAPQIAMGGQVQTGPQDQTAQQQGAPQVPQSDATPTDVGASHQQKADILQDKASVYADIQRRFAGDPEMATAVTTRYNQGLAAANLQQQADAQAALAAQDAGFNKYYTAALKGTPARQLTQAIANDNTLSGTTKEHLVNALQTMGQGKALGSDFYKFFQRVHSDGPDKISTPDQIYGSVDGQSLTIEGADKLRAEMAGKKTIDATATTEMMKGAMAYIKHNLSFEADYGTFKIPDPAGEDIFNSRAIPAFYKAYEDGLKAGKSPYDLLTAGSKDYIGDQIISTFKRTPAQEAKDRIAADAGQGPTSATPAAPTPTASTFDLKQYNVATPEGQSDAALAIKADLDKGSISRVEAGVRLQALRRAAQAATTPQVPNN